MPSTYTLNNGIELIATGEQSGTWGDTTNTNLSLIDTALDGQVTVTLASAGTSGSPNTLAISDGSASDGRNRLVIFADGGDLGATAYVQLTPNDAEKIVYIRNNLSGSRSVILFQGTYNASNDYEVPAGTTAVIFFNGAGAGAVAANVFNNAYFDSLRLGGVSVTAILDEDNMASDSATALATQQSIKAYVDAQVGAQDTLSEILANGNTTGGTDIAVSAGDDITFTTTSKAIFSDGIGGSLQIYHNGSSGFISDQATGNLKVLAQDFAVNNPADTENMITASINGAVSLFYDNAIKLATTATGVDVTGTVTADGLSLTGDIFVNDGSPNVRLVDTDTSRFVDVQYGTRVSSFINTMATGEDIDTVQPWTQFIFKDDGETRTALKINYNNDISFYEDTGTTPKFFWDASAEGLSLGHTGNTSILDVLQSDNITDVADVNSGAKFGRVNSSGNGQTSGLFLLASGNGGSNNGWAGMSVVQPNANSNNADLTFITRGSSIAERMRIDSSGNLLVGTTSQISLEKLSVRSGSGELPVHFTSSAATGDLRISLGTGSGIIEVDPANAVASSLMAFKVDNQEAMRIDSSQRVLIGHTSSPNDIWGGQENRLQVIGNSWSNSGFTLANYATGTAPNIVFAKSRSTTVGTSGTIVVNGDRIGYLNFNGDDGTDMNSDAAAIRVEVDGTPGTDDMPGRIVFATTADGANSPTERMRINSSGHLLVGHTSSVGGTDGAALQVKGNSGVTDFSIALIDGTNEVAGRMHLQSTGSNSISIDADPDDLGSSTFLGFTVDGSERMRIDSTGNVLVGTTAAFTSGGDNSGGNGAVMIARANERCLFLKRAGSNGTLAEFIRGGIVSPVGSISITTTSTSYNTSSDYRLKENVTPLDGAADRLAQIPVHRFNFIADPDTTVDGFLAHEVQAFVPEAVHGEKDAVDADGNPVYQGIDQSKLVPLLTAALQEALTEIENLKARVAALETS